VKRLSDAITPIIIGVIVVAIIAVIFSQKSQTSALAQSFGSAFDGALLIAESPITINQGVAQPCNWCRNYRRIA
jgi:PRD1 phage membrane DNA delivery